MLYSFCVIIAGVPRQLEFLQTQPQFQNLRQVLQRNPEMLQPLLQTIGQSNPQLLQVCRVLGWCVCVRACVRVCVCVRPLC